MPENPIAANRNSRMSLSRRSFLELTGAAIGGAATLFQPGRAWPAESTKRIRLGVVGGNFGATFLWHEHPNCSVTGVTDLVPERRETLRKNYKCDKAYDSLEDMLKQARDIDAVAVFSGAPDHAKHVKMCMERGLHVVSACPVCLTLEDAHMIKELKEKTGLKYMMAESSYYLQDCIFARNLFKQGGFGELFYSEVEYYHNFCDSENHPDKKGTLFRWPDGRRTWRWGYPPMLYSTHSLAFVVGVTRERIKRVSCLGWGQPDFPTLKDNVYKNPFFNGFAAMQTDQGHMCRCNQFWNCKANGVEANWFGTERTLYMAHMGVHDQVQVPGGQVRVPKYWESDMLPKPMRHDSGHGGSAVFISAEFINALLDDREPAIDLYESLAMTVPGIVAHESSLRNGEQLAVPSFDRT